VCTEQTYCGDYCQLIGDALEGQDYAQAKPVKDTPIRRACPPFTGDAPHTRYSSSSPDSSKSSVASSAKRSGFAQKRAFNQSGGVL